MTSGNLYVVSAPSGTGKTTLVKALADSLPKITVSISHTTRPKRAGEIHGVNYFFVDKNEFKKLLKEEDFFEHAVIYDHYYGTSKRFIKESLAKDNDVILEIDWQGHQQIKRLFPETIGIFILPPSLEDLKDRLTKRNLDKSDIIKRRLEDARTNIEHLSEYDYVIINDDFVQALSDLQTILEAGRLQQKRQKIKFAKLISEILAFKNV